MNLHVTRQTAKRLYLALRSQLLQFVVPAASLNHIPPDPASILIISQKRLGDISLEIPAIRSLRKARPEIRIGIVAPAAFHPLLDVMCSPDRLFTYPQRWPEARSLASRLQSERWDMAVDLTTDFHLLPAWVARSSGAEVVAGFPMAGRERYFNRVLPFREKTHMRSRFAAALGVSPSVGAEDPVQIKLDAPSFDFPDSSLRSRVIGLHPGATHPTQMWPAEYFAKLASMIATSGNQCLVLGMRKEAQLVERIVNLSEGNATPLINDGDILRFAAVLQHLDLLVCNNSGPLHLAGLLGVPTVSVMGPTARELWTPVGPKDVVLRKDDLPCIGCNLGYCKIGTHACMQEITPDMVFAAVKRHLQMS